MQPSAKQLSQKTSTSSQDPYSLLRMLLSNSGETATAAKNVMAEDKTLERRLAVDSANMPTGAKTQYSPIQAAGLSALMQIIPQQVNEAVSAGVPYSSVLKDLGLDAQGNPTQQSTVPAYQQQSMIPNAQRQQVVQQGQPQTVSGQQPIAQEEPQQVEPQKPVNRYKQRAEELTTMPKGLLGRLAYGFSSSVRGEELDRLQKAQEIAGEIPLQKRDIEAAGYEAEKFKAIEKIKAALELDKEKVKLSAEEEKAAEALIQPILAPPKLTEAERQDQDLAIVGLETANELASILRSNPNALKELNVPGNPLGQKVATLTQQLRMAILRKESKAAITNQEIDLFKKMGTASGIDAIIRDTSLNADLLNKMGQRFQRIYESVDPNAEDRDLIRFLLEKEYSRKEIADILKKKGRR